MSNRSRTVLLAVWYTFVLAWVAHRVLGQSFVVPSFVYQGF